MSTAPLQGANKQHAIADALESALYVLTWTTLRYVPYKMTSTLLDQHLKVVYDDAVTRFSGILIGAPLAARQHVPRALELKQSSPLLGLLKTMSDPFVTVYDDEPDEGTRCTRVEQAENFRENLVGIYKLRLERSESPDWFQKIIETALNDTWPALNGSSELLCQVQLGTRARSPNEVNIPKRPC